MIFTECPTCNELITYPYECGDEGHGAHGPWLCEKCNEICWVERTSLGGTTFSHEDFKTHCKTNKPDSGLELDERAEDAKRWYQEHRANNPE